MNAPPDHTGLMNASVVATMADAGKAINDTFYNHNRGIAQDIVAPCGPGVMVLDVVGSGPIDYVVTMEDLTRGQRIANYSVEFRRHGSVEWEMLVPVVQTRRPRGGNIADRPDGHDPRDSYIGHKRIDVPIVPRDTPIAQVRFNCIRAIRPDAGTPTTVRLRQFSLHQKILPWKEEQEYHD